MDDDCQAWLVVSPTAGCSDPLNVSPAGVGMSKGGTSADAVRGGMATDLRLMECDSCSDDGGLGEDDGLLLLFKLRLDGLRNRIRGCAERSGIMIRLVRDRGGKTMAGVGISKNLRAPLKNVCLLNSYPSL